MMYVVLCRSLANKHITGGRWVVAWGVLWESHERALNEEERALKSMDPTRGQAFVVPEPSARAVLAVLNKGGL